ncbi:hypothetical protein [Streptomyces sp. TR06-5]|uniref:AMIN-like domain-containing (lipo)protein n=1 Tax=unclassified Streptomyces TaxID=2593676 RepID=UPI0039A29C94
MPHRHRLAAFALASVMLTAGCAQGTGDGAGQSKGRSHASPSPSRSAAPTDASPREVEGRPASGASEPRLRDVEVTGHGTFDRVRFTFSGGVGTVFAEYMQALRDPGRGNRIPLAGEHPLILVFSGVARHRPTLDVEPTAAVREVRSTGVFEGELTVGIGTQGTGHGPAGFRVRMKDDAVLVDIAHRAESGAR